MTFDFSACYVTKQLVRSSAFAGTQTQRAQVLATEPSLASLRRSRETAG